MKRSCGAVRSIKVLLFARVVASATATLLPLFFLWAAAGCSQGRSVAGDQFQIPWPDDQGHYTLQAITISTYDHPESLRGRYSDIVVDPVMKDGALSTDVPIGRYAHTKGGLNVPEDMETLQGTAISAHFERLVAIDQELGVKLRWPLKIAINANLISNGMPIRNNAVFDRTFDALLIAPYTTTSLPIAANAGILAHEHFHTIFQSLVLDHMQDDPTMHQLGIDLSARCAGAVPPPAPSATPLPPFAMPEQTVAVYNSFFLRAINEGLADFWAWVYTGDGDFISHSLPSQQKRRTLTLAVDQLKSQGQLQIYVQNLSGQAYTPEQLIGNAYSIGTDYARAMREIAMTAAGSDSTREGRLVVAHALINALPAIASEISLNQKNKTMISPNVVLKALVAHLPNPGGIACGVIHRLAAPEAASFLTSYPCDGAVPTPTPAGTL